MENRNLRSLSDIKMKKTMRKSNFKSTINTPSTTVSSRRSPHQSLSKSKSFSVAFVLTEEQSKSKLGVKGTCLNKSLVFHYK